MASVQSYIEIWETEYCQYDPKQLFKKPVFLQWGYTVISRGTYISSETYKYHYTLYHIVDKQYIKINM